MKMRKQLSLDLPPTWGGKRKNAGRKPKGERAGVSHRARPRLTRRMPVHVTLRVQRDVYNLRSKRCFKRLETAFFRGGDKFGLRLNQFSVQGNHIHMVVEADDHQALSRGMLGMEVRMARSLNRLMQRRGKVFSDRYHAHVLRTPSEVRRAVSYVLGNHQKHQREWGNPILSGYCDPYSSAYATTDGTGPPTWPARTWLLRSALASAGAASPARTG